MRAKGKKSVLGSVRNFFNMQEKCCTSDNNVEIDTESNAWTDRTLIGCFTQGLSRIQASNPLKFDCKIHNILRYIHISDISASSLIIIS